jgi:peroxiredoxin
MERNDMETGEWVDEKLLALRSSCSEQEWQPDVARALNRVQAQRKDRVRSSRWIWASATVLAGGLGSLAFPAPRAAAERVWAPCVGACESFFAAAARGPSNAPALGIGDLAPDFIFPGAEGGFIHFSAYRGQVVLLNFWATWCPPCLVEIPWFAEFERTLGKRGFAVIGLSMDGSGLKALQSFREAHGIPYTLGLGYDALAQRFGGVDSLPETLLIDRNGRIAAKYTGIVSRDKYEGAIRELLLK